MASKELYICDLDGTLVEDGKCLSADAIASLSDAFEKDNKELIISSARNYLSIKRRTYGLNKDIKIIARNGSVIYDENGNVIYKAIIDKHNVMVAINYAVSRNLCPIIVKVIENTEVIYCNPKHINDQAKKHTNDITVEYIQDFSNVNLQDVIGIYAFGKIEGIYNLPNLNVIKDKDFLQISSSDADKGKALEFVKSIEDYDSITCFGNDANDHPMLDRAMDAYFVYAKEGDIIKKYNNIPFDNAKSIVQIINKGGVGNENINDT